MKSLDSFPRVSLGIFPTPIRKLESISRLLGREVYIKRDDLTGLGLGGNKIRKLEFLLAQAKAQGAEIVFTTGGAQSNHAMLTAAAAGKLGMKAILVLKQRGVTACVGNQLLERLMGTDVRFVDTDDYADIYEEMDRIGRELGRPYYKIPCGGSNALGALGYVDCAREIAGQGLHFDHIVCAEGSGGTMAGLALGARLFLPGTKVHGMMVDTDPFDQTGGAAAGGLCRDHAPGLFPAGHVRARLCHPLSGGKRRGGADGGAGRSFSGSGLYGEGLRGTAGDGGGGRFRRRRAGAFPPFGRGRRALCPGRMSGVSGRKYDCCKE